MKGLQTVVRRDLERYAQVGAPTWVLVRVLLTEPGALASVIFRLQERVGAKHTGAARIMRTLNVLLTGVDISVGASIGAGLKLPHPASIVIGAGANIGQDCTIFQGVTLGRRRLAGNDACDYPHVGDRTTLTVGASLLGGISIGSDVTVAAHSLVIDDVPDGATVAGTPARLIK